MLVGVLVAIGCSGEDGKPCTLTTAADGTRTLTCPGSDPITIANGTNGTNGMAGTAGTAGTDGTNGASGADGMDGTNGTNGTDGTSCTVVDNGDGSKTVTCEDGTAFTVRDGVAGRSGGNVEIGNFHGIDHLLSSGEYADGAKVDVTVTITSATADAAGLATVNFSVATADGTAVTSVTVAKANIAKLLPAADGDSSTRWVDYVYRTVTVAAAGAYPAPAGTTGEQPYREQSGTDPGQGTLTNNHDGTYTYVFATNLMTAMHNGMPVGYDRTLTHRVAVMLGGHSGPTGTGTLDFVPDGSAVTLTRNIVETATCQHCHGQEFHGHGGDRVTAESCMTCHNRDNYDVYGTTPTAQGSSADSRVMFHRIHAGGEMGSMPGPDGILWNDPATTVDESADNNHWGFWSSSGNFSEWWKVGFPAVLDNCRACHQGSGAQADNWRTNPSRAACGSCHDDVDFATGTNHPGGRQMNDMGCPTCHPSEGTGIGGSVTGVHDFSRNDPRNIPEFSAALTVSRPANGMFFVSGESPVVTLVLSEGGTPINHTTVVGDDPAAEGCTLPGPCPPRDGLFRTASLFVHGPRARRVPVLTTAARAVVVATGAGPFDLSAAGASLALLVDMGRDTRRTDATGGDFAVPGTITVTVASAAAGTFPAPAAATTAQIITWLNANTSFQRRAIAFDQGGRVAIRSRNLGRVFAIQLQTSVVTTAVFGGDVVTHMPLGYTTGNNLAQRSNPANNDPKAVRTAGNITYTLDPVNDLAPGTYVADVEIADAGNNTNADYRTPTVARVTFQVGTATEEPLIARNCSTCHEGPDPAPYPYIMGEGTGFVLDARRHAKHFNDSALDQCGNCHDYQPQYSTGAMTDATATVPSRAVTAAELTAWSGARPISRRVHAVHFGSSLDHALDSVDYVNGDPVAGRNWDITFPRDVRDCQVCHVDGTTSGTWLTRPARIPCSGCHDSDAAMAHFRIMTYDPTPAAPYSGDEVDSCPTCHVFNSTGSASTTM